MFSRIRPSLTLEADNRLYKAIVLPVLVIVILCAMNVDKKTATRLNDYKDEQLSTDQIMTKLGLETLYYRRRTHILRFVNECITNRVPRYFFNYFNVRKPDIQGHQK